MKEQKRERPAVREDREPFEGVSLGGGNSEKLSPTPPEKQAALDVDDWRARVIQDADAFMKRKGRSLKWGRR